MININSKDPAFEISTTLSNHEFIEKIAISFEKKAKKKILYVNGEPINLKRQSDVKNYLINFIFLTPQIEQLFILGKSDRRHYLDKIVSDIDLTHSTRITNYQKLLKERLMIMQKYRGKKEGDAWVSVVENNIVELGVAIASARIEALDFFNKAIKSFPSNFPKTELRVIGEIEEKIGQESALKIEEFYKAKLKANRTKDLESFRTSFGVHRSDFDAIFLDKNMPATLCSTGEQKAIMMSITLSRAKISSSYKNLPTMLIFDEIVSHLDSTRKTNLFEEIIATNLQAFFSATSTDLIPEEFIDKNLIDIVKL